VLSVGLKVTLSVSVPTLGVAPGDVKANVPLTAVPLAEAVPPVSVDCDSLPPKVIALAVGHAVTVGVAWLTVTVTEPVTVV